MRGPTYGVLCGVTGLVGILLISAGPASSAVEIPPPAARPGDHPDAPPPAHTGGFGEPTCHICHAEYELDGPYGSVSLEDVPEVAEPGSTHRVRVVVEAEGTVAAGFQLSARASDGVQAGRLRAVDDRVRVTPGATPAGDVLFAHQTQAGSTGPERVRTTWTVEWVAPAASTEVVWSLSANSANGDNSPFGDLVWTTTASSRVKGS